MSWLSCSMFPYLFRICLCLLFVFRICRPVPHFIYAFIPSFSMRLSNCVHLWLRAVRDTMQLCAVCYHSVLRAHLLPQVPLEQCHLPCRSPLHPRRGQHPHHRRLAGPPVRRRRHREVRRHLIPSLALPSSILQPRTSRRPLRMGTIRWSLQRRTKFSRRHTFFSRRWSGRSVRASHIGAHG